MRATWQVADMDDVGFPVDLSACLMPFLQNQSATACCCDSLLARCPNVNPTGGQPAWWVASSISDSAATSEDGKFFFPYRQGRSPPCLAHNSLAFPFSLRDVGFVASPPSDPTVVRLKNGSRVPACFGRSGLIQKLVHLYTAAIPSRPAHTSRQACEVRTILCQPALATANTESRLQKLHYWP